MQGKDDHERHHVADDGHDQGDKGADGTIAAEKCQEADADDDDGPAGDVKGPLVPPGSGGGEGGRG